MRVLAHDTISQMIMDLFAISLHLLKQTIILVAQEIQINLNRSFLSFVLGSKYEEENIFVQLAYNFNLYMLSPNKSMHLKTL